MSVLYEVSRGTSYGGIPVCVISAQVQASNDMCCEGHYMLQFISFMGFEPAVE